ncbi:hypothetical protein Tco_0371872 [Tanacetum coccineum]
MDALKLLPCYNAFLVIVDVPEIYMHQFWFTISKIKDSSSYQFKLDNKKFRIDVVDFHEILHICPKVPNQEFIEPPSHEDILTFIKSLSFKGALEFVLISFESQELKSCGKKGSFIADDNIIPDPDVALELGKSISKTEAQEQEDATKVQETHERLVTAKPTSDEESDEYDDEPARPTGRRRQTGVVLRDTSNVPDETKGKSTNTNKGAGITPEVLDVSKATSGVQDMDEEDWGLDKDDIILTTYDVNEEMKDAKIADEDKEKGDTEQAGNDQAIKDAQVKDDDQSPPLLPVPVSVIPEQTIPTPTPVITTLTSASTAPLQVPVVHAFTSMIQQSTPIPTPPTTSEATTITTIIHDPLPAVIQRLLDLESKFEAWTKVDHSEVIAEVVQTNVINEVKNQLPKLLPKAVSNFHDSQKDVLKIQKIKLDHATKQQLPKCLAKPFDQELYDALMLSPILDEDDMERAKAAKPHTQKKRRHDDKVQDPHAGLDQGMKKRKKREETVFEAADTDLFLDKGDDIEKPPLNFDDLMSNPIDFTAFALNRLKISKLTKVDLVGPIYNLLKVTCKSCVELEYNIKECYRALYDQIDRNNREGDRCPYDLRKPLPFIEREYTTSATKTKVAKYGLDGIEDMIPKLWSPVKVDYNKNAALGISHWGPKH